MRLHPSMIAAGALALALSACAPSLHGAGRPTLAVSAERLSEDVRVLADDSFQGRRPNTDGERLTLAYLQEQYEAIGLQPGGPDGQWLQPVTLSRYSLQPGASLSVGGGDLVASGAAVVRAAYGDGQASVTNAPVVFAGYGISAPERNWDDYGATDVRGAVVVLLQGEPDDARFNGEYPTLYGLELYKTEEAFRRGAAAVILMAPVASNSPQWSRYRDRYGSAQTNIIGVENIEAVAYVGSEALDGWLTQAGLDAAAVKGEALTEAFETRVLAGLTASLSAREAIEDIPTFNLLARLPGTERPNETIILSAHWDHVGMRDTPDSSGDTIYNGAWDNASGTAGVLELARVMASEGPRARSVVFAHMAAEEMGLLGSYFYAENPVYPLETTVADINIDMLPLSPPTRDLAIFGVGQNSLEDDLAALAATEGRLITDDGQPEQGFYYRSDHFPFALAGVPALMPWHGVDWDEGGREAGQPAYRQQFRTLYHQRADEWSADIDWRSAVENLTLLHRLAVQLADGDQWPTWKPMSEFARTRSASDAVRQ